MKKETILDKEALDTGEFKNQGGGFQRLNKTFNGELENILVQINEELWFDVGAEQLMHCRRSLLYNF